jgi:hypothetical protein
MSLITAIAGINILAVIFKLFAIRVGNHLVALSITAAILALWR